MLPGVPDLLKDTKNYLDITWDDEALDRKLEELIYQGKSYLSGKLGEEADYLSPGLPRMLLFDYVRYARDGAADIFENNYVHLILAMQNERLVSRYAQGADETEQ